MDPWSKVVHYFSMYPWSKVVHYFSMYPWSKVVHYFSMDPWSKVVHFFSMDPWSKVVHHFSMDPWSKVVHYLGNSAPFVTPRQTSRRYALSVLAWAVSERVSEQQIRQCLYSWELSQLFSFSICLHHSSLSSNSKLHGIVVMILSYFPAFQLFRLLGSGRMQSNFLGGFCWIVFCGTQECCGINSGPHLWLRKRFTLRHWLKSQIAPFSV